MGRTGANGGAKGSAKGGASRAQRERILTFSAEGRASRRRREGAPEGGCGETGRVGG